MADEDDLTVAEAAEALGTSPQTVRALLRKGELARPQAAVGKSVRLGSQSAGVDYFLSHARATGRSSPTPGASSAPAEEAPRLFLRAAAEASRRHTACRRNSARTRCCRFEAVERPVQRPFVLRPRGRATVVVVVLGVPLLLAYGTARILPDALWFNELGQADVFRRVLIATSRASTSLVTGSGRPLHRREPRRSGPALRLRPDAGAVSRHRCGFGR